MRLTARSTNCPLENNALRMLMIGRAKKNFDLWEADRDPTDTAKTYEEFLNRGGDVSWTAHPRRRFSIEVPPWT